MFVSSAGRKCKLTADLCRQISMKKAELADLQRKLEAASADGPDDGDNDPPGNDIDGPQRLSKKRRVSADADEDTESWGR